MDILPSVTGNSGTVLVASAGYGDDDDFVFFHCRCDLHCVCDSVCRFNSRNNTLGFCQIFKGVYRFVICDWDILGPSDIVQMSMFRTNAGVIQSCGNRVNRSDLSVLILTEI